MKVAGEIQRDADAFERLEPEWWDLWRRCPQATPFQSPAWLIPWWRSFAPGSLFVLAARRGGKLVGLAPGYIENGDLGRRVLPVGISLSDHLDVLIDPDCVDEAAAALAQAGAEHSDEWDSWEFEELLEGAAAFAIPVPRGCSEERVEASPFSVLEIGRGADLSDVLPGAKRRKIRLARNRAERRGEVAIEEASAANAPEFLADLFRLHEARWKGMRQPGLLRFEGVKAFHREAVPRLQAAGHLRLWRLTIGRATAAACYGLEHAGVLSLYMTGFDPDFAFESPGVILLAHAIEHSLENGLERVDFLRGDEDYKRGWGVTQRWNVKRTFRQAGANGLAA